jgi:hypothetical protein
MIEGKFHAKEKSVLGKKARVGERSNLKRLKGAPLWGKS